ncbi:MAG: DsrE family protein [Desulfuromusa sp.]|nr:DsrE family protein [Desulfuromusa sp.]
MRNFFILVLLLIIPDYSLAVGQLDNKNALQGVTEAKAVFDINQGDPAILKTRLQLIERTYNQLKTANTSPKFVLTFRGQASYFLTTGKKYVAEKDHEIKLEIKTLVERLKLLGLPLEQCAIAAGMAKISTDDFLPQIKVVANGYTSLIGYQNKGYAFIPME